MKSNQQQLKPAAAATMPMNPEQRRELLRTQVAPAAFVIAVMLGIAWVSPATVALGIAGLFGLLAVLGKPAGMHPVGAVKDLLSNTVCVQTTTLLARDIALPLRLRGAPGDATQEISGYFGTFEGIGKLRIGYTAFEEGTIGAAYRVTFSPASRRAWAVERPA